jgi:UDP-N-acetyl-D-glucosamine/UDP-N-acetyl-D-galactosamine dehydrogenase
MIHDPTICVIGLGYVGLPLAHAFARAGIATLGYDVDAKRIAELNAGRDRTNELSESQLKEIQITYSNDPSIIARANVVILAIPTPVDEQKKPDLSLLKKATETVAEHVQDGSVAVYESTVYPGVTEEICGPIIKAKKKVKLGYSPERINPGDKEHTIDKIVKVVSGEDRETTDFLCSLYAKIIPAGIHRAPNIKTAEMAKAIENAQRDLNVAYINEVAMLCNALSISTRDVLDAAETKWAFLPFTPGLVGGHCIGVDPYYLVAKAEELGMCTQVITAGRSTNDGMAAYVAAQIAGRVPNGGSVLLLGLSFKENVPDDRNAGSKEVAKKLESAGLSVMTHDPYLTEGTIEGTYDAIALLVPHKAYLQMSAEDFKKFAKKQCLFYDLKSVFKKEDIEAEGMTYAAL